MASRVMFPIELDRKNIHLRDYLLEKLGKYADLAHADFLELGIGNGRFGFLLGKSVAHYFGIEPDNEYLAAAMGNISPGTNVTYVEGRAEKIPFAMTFDVLLYAHSWHFIKDFGKAISEANRVLKPSGVMVVLEPSESTTEWGDPRLRRSSEEFIEKIYERKLRQLERGRKAIMQQKTFDIVEQDYDAETTLNLFVLKKRK